MISVCFTISILYFKICLAQLPEIFPPHVDLKQVGDYEVNNVTYKVLKPAVHEIIDHFQEQMLRTESRPGRVFLDNNGFRHIWEEIGQNFRKNDDTGKEKNKNIKDNVKNGINNEAGTKKLNIPKESATEKMYNKTDKVTTELDEDLSMESKLLKRHQLKIRMLRAAKATTKAPTKATTKAAAKKDKADAAKGDAKGAAKGDAKGDSKGDGKGGGRTAVKTVFFCPFMGIITMNAFAD